MRELDVQCVSPVRLAFSETRSTASRAACWAGASAHPAAAAAAVTSAAHALRLRIRKERARAQLDERDRPARVAAVPLPPRPPQLLGRLVQADVSFDPDRPMSPAVP